MPPRAIEGHPAAPAATHGASAPIAAHGIDDAALLARVADGNADAFRLLVDRHLPILLATARRILSDEAEAEDIAQEALIRLWQGSDALQVGDSGVRPWLRRVVSNLAIDRIRARRRTDVTDEVPEQPVQADQLSGLADRDLTARVEAALQALPERQRQALVLFHFQDMSQIEVGDVLGVSDEAVESLLARARRALRTALNDEWRQLLPDMD